MAKQLMHLASLPEFDGISKPELLSRVVRRFESSWHPVVPVLKAIPETVANTPDLLFFFCETLQGEPPIAGIIKAYEAYRFPPGRNVAESLPKFLELLSPICPIDSASGSVRPVVAPHIPVMEIEFCLFVKARFLLAYLRVTTTAPVGTIWRLVKDRSKSLRDIVVALGPTAVWGASAPSENKVSSALALHQ